MNPPEALATYRSEIDCAMRDLFRTRSMPLYSMMRYQLGWVDALGNEVTGPHGGKALRPALCCFACRTCGGDVQAALPAAAAIELIHNFSLVHDDVQDDDTLRRNRPTVWSVWGKPQAINVGTAMRIVANTALRDLSDGGGETLRLAVQDILDDATLRLLEGQYLDISFESRSDVTETEYLQMISGKTAALIAASLETGALIGGCDRARAARFALVGEALGKAFQIRDDILGIWGDSRAFGKPIGSDVRKRKKTYPIIAGCAGMEVDRRDALLETMEHEAIDDDTVEAIIAELDASGSKEKSQELVTRYTEEADRALATVGLAQEDEVEFRVLFDYLAGRER